MKLECRIVVFIVSYLFCTVKLAYANVEYAGNNEGSFVLGQFGSFSWEDLLRRSVSFEEMPSNELRSSDFTRQFLAQFGATLDHCNRRIEEAAVVSEYMIKRFMDTVVRRSQQHDGGDDVLKPMVDQNEIINDNLKVPPYDHIDVRLLNSDSNFWPSLLNVLGVLSEACDDLPVQIVESDMEARQQHSRQQTVLDDIISAMTRWTAEWSEKVKMAAEVFLDDCVAVENCEKNLRLIMDVLGQSLEDSLRSHSRVEALLRSYSDKDRNSVSHEENAVDDENITVAEGNAVVGEETPVNSNESIVNDVGTVVNDEELSINADKPDIYSRDVPHHPQEEPVRTSSPNQNSLPNSLAGSLRTMLVSFGEFFGFESNDSDREENQSSNEIDRENGEGKVLANREYIIQQVEPGSNMENKESFNPSPLSMGLLARVTGRERDEEDLEAANGRQNALFNGESERAAPMFSVGGQRILRLISSSLAVLKLPLQSQGPTKVVLRIDGDNVVNTVTDQFLSFALESNAIQKENTKFDTKSLKLRRLMQPLKNAVFRLGGSSANYLFFAPNEEPVRPARRTNPTDTNTWRSPYSADSKRGLWQQNEHSSLPRSPIVKKYNSRDRNESARPGFLNTEAATQEAGSSPPRAHPKHLTSKKGEWRLNSIHSEHVHPKFHQAPLESLRNGAEETEGSRSSRRRRSLTTAAGHHPKLLGRLRDLYHAHTDPRLLSAVEAETPDFDNFTLTASEFRDLLDLCEALNWTLLFDVNQFTRDVAGGWDPGNARLIVAAAAQSNASVIWQLGNEPNNYAHKYPFSTTGTEMAGDVQRLKNILELTASRHLDSVRLVGPDVTRPQFPPLGGRQTWAGNTNSHQSECSYTRTHQHGIEPALGSDSVQFLADFLGAAPHLVDAVSWHQYYVCGRTATVSDFLAPSTMDLFPRQLEAIRRVRDERSLGTPIWLTETGSAYGGGAPGLSDRFAGAFLWLDKLGVAARGGVDVVARQSIFGGHYALLDQDYNPNPDYWVSVLHKQLVGHHVLDLQALGAPTTLRLYAHCMKPTHHLHRPGSVVVYGVNAGDQGEGITVAGATADTPALEYILTPALGDLTTRDVLLNGVPLQSGADGSVPDLLPHETTAHELRAPPHSVGFWVLQQSGISVCV